MFSSTSDDDGKVVEFPKTAEERKALRKAKQTVEQQSPVDRFVDEASDDALFATADGVALRRPDRGRPSRDVAGSI